HRRGSADFAHQAARFELVLCDHLRRSGARLGARHRLESPLARERSTAMKGLLPHVAALALATALALVVWSRGDKAGDADVVQKIEVWGGSPERVESIRFESPQRTVNLTAKKDATGTYYVATVDKEEGSRPKPSASADAGAPPPPEAPPKRVTTHFIAVKEAG